jgi:hypothetical protein
VDEAGDRPKWPSVRIRLYITGRRDVLNHASPYQLHTESWYQCEIWDTAVSMNLTVFWNMTPTFGGSVTRVNRRWRGGFFLTFVTSCHPSGPVVSSCVLCCQWASYSCNRTIRKVGSLIQKLVRNEEHRDVYRSVSSVAQQPTSCLCRLTVEVSRAHKISHAHPAGLLWTWYHLWVISGFYRDVDEICALLGYHAALSGSSVPTFRDNISSPLEDGTYMLSRNVGTELPLNAA